MTTPLLENKTRRRAGFARPADGPVVDIEEYRAMSLRERVNKWLLQAAREGAGLPSVVIVYYILKVASWWALFIYVIADRSQEFSTEKNVKRFVAYNILNDALGFGATNGPLGGRNSVPVETWYHFLRPGTICSPLFPRIAGCFQSPAGVRGIVPVLLFIAYCASLVYAICQPMIGSQEVAITVGIVSVLTVFDTYVIMASRLEIYVYQFVCFACGQWVFGNQMIMIALWLWAAVSKLGPWFVYVFLFMVPNNPFLQCLPIKDNQNLITRMMYVNFPDVMKPSRFAYVLMFLGTVLEIAMSTLPMLPSTVLCQGLQVRLVGVTIAVLYHCFIISMMPLASVFEWNCYMIFMTLCLFKDREFELPQMRDMPLWYVAFLVVALVIIPFVGQIAPKLVPFLLGYRPYAGNWRWCWFVVSAKAEHKLKRMKTLTSPSPSDQAKAMLANLRGPMSDAEVENFALQFPAFSPYVCLYFPQFRMLLDIVERLMKHNKWGADDFVNIAGELVQANACGWSMGVGWMMYREVWREAFQHVCQWEEGECYFVQIEPMGLFSRSVEWRCFDVTVGPTNALMYGAVPYKELAGVDTPADFKLKENEIHSGKSIKGTFLGTYY